MFITDELNPGELLAELMKGRRVTPEATGRFARLKHDKDLCPKFSLQVNTMLDVYRAYGHEAHDIQGFSDDGVDVLLKYEDRNGQSRRAGIQIKSEDEFVQWERKTLPLISKLKAQHGEAVANVGVDEFYIVPCVDAVKHQSRIRTLCSQLKNFKPCTIIEPTDALGLFEMDGMEIWARSTRLLCAHDKVLTSAIDELDAEAPDTAFFLVALVCQAFGGDLQVKTTDLTDLWSEWEDFAGEAAGRSERVSDILATLQDAGVLKYVGWDYELAVDRLPTALCALYFDQKVRALDVRSELRHHLLSLVALADRLEPEVEEDDEDQEAEA